MFDVNGVGSTFQTGKLNGWDIAVMEEIEKAKQEEEEKQIPQDYWTLG